MWIRFFCGIDVGHIKEVIRMLWLSHVMFEKEANKMVRKTLIGILLVSFFILPEVLLAGEMDMGKMEMMGNKSGVHHKHVTTLKKVLKFERSLLKKSDAIKIGYVYKKGDAASEKAKDKMMMMGKGMSAEKIGGKTVSFTQIEAGSLSEKLKAEDINVVYLGVGLSMNTVMSAKSYGKSQGALIMGSVEDHVHEGHAAVGIIAESDKIHLVINLTAAKETGVDFDPRLLRLADEIFK